jgi:hypothetical protein
VTPEGWSTLWQRTQQGRDALLAGLWFRGFLDGLEQAPSLGGSLSLKRLHATGLGKSTVNILGKGDVIGVRGP